MNKAEILSKIQIIMQYWPLEKPSFIDHCSLNFRTTKEEKAVVRVILNKTVPGKALRLVEIKEFAEDAVAYMKKAFKELTGEKLDAKKVNEEALVTPRNLNGDMDVVYFVDLEIALPEEK